MFFLNCSKEHSFLNKDCQDQSNSENKNNKLELARLRKMFVLERDEIILLKNGLVLNKEK